MTMSGTKGNYQMTGVQSTSYYTPPFTLTATVEGIVAHGNAFGIYLTSTDFQNQLSVKGNTDSANGFYYGIRVGSGTHVTNDHLLYSSPQNNVSYTFQMTIDANGKGSVLMSNGNKVLGNVTDITVGTGPFFLILGQWEGNPYAPGPNVAIWQSVELMNGTNQPPNTPQKPFGPTSGYAEYTYNYTTNTSDPNNDRIYYQWNWGDGTYSTWLGPYDSGEVASASHRWSPGNYGIEVKAKNVHMLESGWSDPLSIHIDANKYPIISNPTPINNSVNVPINTSSLSVIIQDLERDHFNWNITTSPNIGSNSSTNASNGTKNCVVTNLAYSTTYTWKVNVYDGIHWTNQTYKFTTATSNSGTKGKGTPGFEFILIFGAITIALFLWRKKRTT